MPVLCRTCLNDFDHTDRCPKCQSPRVVNHAELFSLSIAHMDCDAFYASVEKRDNPDLRDKPVIIGGGRRGVVSTACYLARIHGVRSAMPMFQATKLCPDAVIVKPRMDVYAEVSRQVRKLMDALSPIVEPLSLDEAFIDMTGTERLHGAPPAVMLAKLLQDMETQIGVSGSVGLSHNKFLAKVASDLDKPRGFSVIGRAETETFLRDKPVGLIWGIGPAAQEALAKAGILTFDDLRRWDEDDLVRRFGNQGQRLWHLARGQDARQVNERERIKSLSNETTFFEDTSDLDVLDGHIWRLSEKVASRAKAKTLAGRVVTLKLKKSNHKVITRRHSLHSSTQLCDTIYRNALELFQPVSKEAPFRLLGVGLSALSTASDADDTPDLLDPDAAKRAATERVTDAVREKFGRDAIKRGRALR